MIKSEGQNEIGSGRARVRDLRVAGGYSASDWHVALLTTFAALPSKTLVKRENLRYGEHRNGFGLLHALSITPVISICLCKNKEGTVHSDRRMLQPKHTPSNVLLPYCTSGTARLTKSALENNYVPPSNTV